MKTPSLSHFLSILPPPRTQSSFSIVSKNSVHNSIRFSQCFFSPRLQILDQQSSIPSFVSPFVFKKRISSPRKPPSASNQQSSINNRQFQILNRKFLHSFRAKCEKSDFYSPCQSSPLQMGTRRIWGGACPACATDAAITGGVGSRIFVPPFVSTKRLPLSPINNRQSSISNSLIRSPFVFFE